MTTVQLNHEHRMLDTFVHDSDQPVADQLRRFGWITNTQGEAAELGFAFIKHAMATGDLIDEGYQAAYDVENYESFRRSLAALDARAARGIPYAATIAPSGRGYYAASAEDAYFIRCGRFDLAATRG